jgi:hypothetical protein
LIINAADREHVLVIKRNRCDFPGFIVPLNDTKGFAERLAAAVDCDAKGVLYRGATCTHPCEIAMTRIAQWLATRMNEPKFTLAVGSWQFARRELPQEFSAGFPSVTLAVSRLVTRGALPLNQHGAVRIHFRRRRGGNPLSTLLRERAGTVERIRPAADRLFDERARRHKVENGEAEGGGPCSSVRPRSPVFANLVCSVC